MTITQKQILKALGIALIVVGPWAIGAGTIMMWVAKNFGWISGM